MCEWRSVRICCYESPHAEAVSSSLRLFHTVSEGVFCEVRYPQATPSYGKDIPLGRCTPTSVSGILLLMVGLL
jgi:hypothetical protein